jgi:TPR repeat protein
VGGIMSLARCLAVGVGVGVAAAPEEALEQWRKAAALGHTRAQVATHGTACEHPPSSLLYARTSVRSERKLVHVSRSESV